MRRSTVAGLAIASIVLVLWAGPATAEDPSQEGPGDGTAFQVHLDEWPADGEIQLSIQPERSQPGAVAFAFLLHTEDGQLRDGWSEMYRAEGDGVSVDVLGHGATSPPVVTEHRGTVTATWWSPFGLERSYVLTAIGAGIDVPVTVDLSFRSWSDELRTPIATTHDAGGASSAEMSGTAHARGELAGETVDLSLRQRAPVTVEDGLFATWRADGTGPTDARVVGPGFYEETTHLDLGGGAPGQWSFRAERVAAAGGSPFLAWADLAAPWASS